MFGLILTAMAAAVACTAAARAAAVVHLRVLTAPANATIVVDGRRARSGVTDLSPGRHTISVSAPGFAPEHRSVTLTGNAQVEGFILSGTTSATKDAYDNSPAYMRAYEGVMRTVDPIIHVLPYLGPGIHYRVDTSLVSKRQNFPDVVVRYDSSSAKQDAILWMKQSGYLPMPSRLVFVRVPANSL